MKQVGKTANKSRIILIIVFALILVITGAVLYKTYKPEKENFEEYKNEVEITTSDTKTELPENPIDFNALRQENPDVCAWIKFEDVDIDYPVLQSGENTAEDFYLNHDWHRNEKNSGALYVQKNNSPDFTDNNTIIYGHNMRNTTMFGLLARFRDRAFFDDHKKFTVYTPGHIREYEIYSAFTFTDEHLFHAFDFSTEEGFGKFINETLHPQKSVHFVRNGVSVTTADKIVTLSTCNGNSAERYLVAAVLKSDTLTK